MSAEQGVYVLGAGGHAKVVISTLRAAGYHVQAIYDDNSALWAQRCLGVTIRGPISEVRTFSSPRAVIAIGENVVRKRLAVQLPNVKWVTVVHPRAIVDPSVRLGPGTVVFAGAVLQPDTVIGAHAVINTGATVDHDCLLGDYAHVAPGVHLAGGVHLGAGAFLGIGCVAVPGIEVGAWSVVGAGGVIVDNLSSAILAVGAPAHRIKEIEIDD